MTGRDAEAGAVVRRIAAQLLPQLPAIGRGTAEYIFELVPEFDHPEVAGIALEACQANSAALLDALVRGVSITSMSPSLEVLQTTRDLVRAQTISLEILIRGYQVGLAFWCQRWSDAVRSDGELTDVGLALAVLDHGTTFLLSWLQMVTDRLSVEYRDEAERVSREWSMARVAEVRAALTARDLDVPSVSRRLAYDLEGHHVAVVMVRDGAGATMSEVTMREVASTIAGSRPLVALVDSNTAWCWVPTGAGTRAHLDRRGVVCGVGRPGRGLQGFRRSHHEALEAVRVARLVPVRDVVTHFDDVQLLSVCSRDPDALEQFVLSVLGGLAAPGALEARLRETLSGFYSTECNFRATAARLDLHHNTVRYRVSQAEELLGRTYDDRRLETELALHLADRLGLPNC